MAGDIRVFLIGGTSHTGKSTAASQLADRLGWKHLSTDQLARHPGRPWRDDDQPLPADVADYYGGLPADTQLSSVLAHYRDNVWPIAAALIQSHLNNPYDPCLVFEGSALLPELVHAAGFRHLSACWLSAPDEEITRRIVASSQLRQRSKDGDRLIEAFIERSLACNRAISNSTNRSGQRRVSLIDPGDLERFVDEAALEIAR